MPRSRGSESRCVESARQPQHQQRGRFRLQREIRQHVLHERLIDQQAPEGAPVPGMMDGLHQRLAHQRRRPHHAVQTRVLHHFDDGGHPAPFLTHALRPGAVELHFTRSVGAVAELGFQPLDVKRVAFSIRSPARQQKTRQAPGRLRQHQECIRHRRRTKPLVPGQQIFARSRRLGHARVRAHIRAALLLGHRHADQHSGFPQTRGGSADRSSAARTRGVHSRATSGC